MSIEIFDKDMRIISALSDEPNDVDGLTATELKAKFDEGGVALAAYINETLVAAINDLLNGGSLTFDETPTAGSTNPVTSRGIKSAIDAITPPSITLDNVPTAGSDNPVKSQGIKSWTEALLAAAVYASIGGGY